MAQTGFSFKSLGFIAQFVLLVAWPIVVFRKFTVKSSEILTNGFAMYPENKKEQWSDLHRKKCIVSFKGVINVGEMQCDYKMTIFLRW